MLSTTSNRTFAEQAPAAREAPSDIKSLVASLQVEAAGEHPPGGLAAMLDPAGGVHLAEALGRAPEPGSAEAGPSPRGHASAESTVERQARRALDALQRRLSRTFEDAFKPRYRLPGPARCLALLQDSGALARRNAQGRPRQAELVRARRTLWAPFGTFIDTQYKRTRFDLRQLRTDVGASIRAKGGDAARLEQVDALIMDAIRVEGERRYRRLFTAIEARFSARLEQLTAALPEQPVAQDLEHAFGAEGAFPEAVRLGRGAVFAVLGHERALLEGLMDAAASYASPPGRIH